MLKIGSGVSLGLAALMLAALGGHVAQAASFSVTCAREDTMVPDWKGPLSVAYEGGDHGTITVTSEHLTMTLPGSRSTRAGEVDGSQISAEAVQGSADLTAIMPDLAALRACAEQAAGPDFSDDADVLAMSMIGCVARTAPTPAPVPVHASVNIVQLAGEAGVVVEIKRRYAGADGVTLESYPVNCTRDPG